MTVPDGVLLKLFEFLAETKTWWESLGGHVMTHAAIIIEPDDLAPAWASLLPGAHMVLWPRGDWMGPSLVARRTGWELRDTMMVLGPQGARPALLWRKPLTEPTLIDQVLKTGTGAINIDATRVKHQSPEDLERHRLGVEALKAKGGVLGNSWKNSSDLSGANDVTTAGRWPANLIFMHAQGCQQTGSQKLPAPVINRFVDGMKPFGNGAGHGYESHQTGDADGNEDVPQWECAEGCPVGELDRQSGILTSGSKGPCVRSNRGSYSGPMPAVSTTVTVANTGGASRFFKQFRDDGEVVQYFTDLILPHGGCLYRRT